MQDWEQVRGDTHNPHLRRAIILGDPGFGKSWLLPGSHTTPPLFSLSGGSAGGAFFANLWHVLTGTLSDVSVTISAGITSDGLVLPVEHILKKRAAVLGFAGLSDLVVAEDQPEVQAGQDDRLRIWKVRHAADLEQHGRHPAPDP